MIMSINAGGFSQSSSNVSKVFGMSTESFDAVKGEDPNLASEIPRVLAAFAAVESEGTLSPHSLNKIDHHLRMLESKLRTSESPNAGLLTEIADQLEEIRETHEPDCRCLVEETGTTGNAREKQDAVALLMGMSKSIDTLDELAGLMAMMSVYGNLLNTSQLSSISKSITDFAKEGVEKLDSPEQKADFLSTVIKMVESAPAAIDTSELEDMLEDVKKELVDKQTKTDAEPEQAQQEERTPDFIVTGASESFAGAGIHLLDTASGQSASVPGIDAPLGQSGPKAVSLNELVFGTLKLQQSPIQVQPLDAAHNDAYWIAEVEKPGTTWLNEARGKLGKEYAAALFAEVNEQMQFLAESLTEEAINNFPGIEGIELI